MSLAEGRLLISNDARMAILIGFMGAFTTVSTFAYETGRYVGDGEWHFAAANLLVQNVLGVGLVLLGMRLGRMA